MIIHHVPIKKNQQGSFKKLVKYLTDPQNKQERVGEKRITNCHSVVTDWATVEIEATQAKNSRAKGDKTYHLVISFAPGEKPSKDVIQEVENSVVESIGLDEHQRISVTHHDTDNLHIHLAINKVHPSTYKMVEPYKAYKKLAKCAESLEIKYGLVKTNHVARYQKSENLANDMEAHTGTESLINWIKKTCLKELINSQSWSELHQVLSQKSLTLKAKGNGFIISSNNELFVKASSISRQISKAKLEQKLGTFMQLTAMTDGTQSKYEIRPLEKSALSKRLFAQYKKEQIDNQSLANNKINQLTRKKNILLNKASKKSKLKRKAINLLEGSSLSKKVVHQVVSHQYKKEVEKIKSQYNKEKQEVFKKHKRLVWKDWLKLQAANGNADAINLLKDSPEQLQKTSVNIISRFPIKTNQHKLKKS